MQPQELLTLKNIEFLKQGHALIERLDDEVYSAPTPPLGNSGVGAHFRHCFDYYRCFLHGVDSGKVDYDARHRDPKIEVDRRHAQGCIDELIDRLRLVSRFDATRELEVSVDSPERELRHLQWSRSTLLRELQMLVSHTVHHYALIAVLLRSRGLDPGADFGVAPSTLDHWQQTAVAC